MISIALLAVLSLDAASIAQNTATLSALGPHPFGSPRNRAAAEFVAAKLQESGLAQTALDPFELDGASGVNVVASLPGRTDRLVIVATHHDSGKDAVAIADRSRSLSLLIEVARQASRLRPAKTWILASFDGGESRGEGLAHYLEALGKSRDLVDGIILIDAGATQNADKPPTLVAPACPSGSAPEKSALAGRDLVAASLSGIPDGMEVSFDDPGISLLTQPFVRTFKTSCDPGVARALASGFGAVIVTDQAYSQSFLSRGASPNPKDEPKLRDNAAVRLGDAVLAVLQGVDGATIVAQPSSSWLVVGRSVFSGLFVVIVGLLSLLPGLIASRSKGTLLAARVAYSAIFSAVLFAEPEIALFSGLLPNLVPPHLRKPALVAALAPFFFLVAAGALAFARGQVTGTWLSVWEWLGLVGAFLLLYLSQGSGKKTAAKGNKRGKR